MKNQQYVQLKDMASRQSLTLTQKANLDAFNERLFPVHQYALGSEVKLRAETFARTDKAENTRLKTATVTAKTKLKAADEIFEAIKRSRVHRPLEKQWEKMLSTYDIHFQQYYIIHLIGEHIHRLLKNSADICDKVLFIFLYIYAMNQYTQIFVRQNRSWYLTAGTDGVQIAEITLIVAQVQELMDAFDFLSNVILDLICI